MNSEKLKTLFSFLSEDPRIDNIKRLFADYGMDRILEAPYGHNSNKYAGVYPGGWVGFVHRNLLNVASLYNFYKEDEGFDTESFTQQELIFCSIFSHIWKLGYPEAGNEFYIPQTNTWRRNNLGEVYTFNPSHKEADQQQINLYILQKYEIPVTYNEYEGIYNSDKMLTGGGASKMITSEYNSNIPYILSVNFIKTILDLKVEAIKQGN
jgi:hypothetical protein